MVGKKYAVGDNVSPICDSIERFHGGSEIVGWGGFKRRSVDDVLQRSPFLPDGEEKKQQQSTSQNRPECKGCGATGALKFTLDQHEGVLVCNECGAVGEKVAMEANYNETHDAQEKATARAEVLHVETVASKPSAPKAKARGPVEVLRQPVREFEPGANYAPDVKKKFIAILMSIETFRREYQATEQVAREVRLMAERVYDLALEHRRHCKDKRSCTLELNDRPPRLIAQKVFLYTAQKLADEGLDGVSKETLTSLYRRCCDLSNLMNTGNGVQHEGCMAIIATIDTDPEALCRPCQPVPAAAVETKTKKARLNVTFTKQLSDVGEETCSSQIVELRNAIRTVCRDEKFASHVRDSAVNALTDRGFVTALEKGVILLGMSKYAKAYSIMLGVAKAKEASTGTSSRRSAAASERGLAKYGLAGVDMAQTCADVVAQLPAVASAEDRGTDDELY